MMEMKFICFNLERSFSKLFTRTKLPFKNYVRCCHFSKDWDNDIDEIFGSRKSDDNRLRRSRNYDDNFEPRRNFRDRSYDSYGRQRNRYSRNFSDFDENRRHSHFPRQGKGYAMKNFPAKKWDSTNMTPFEKNFLDSSISYPEEDSQDVKEFRRMHNIILQGENIPYPVLGFSNCKFPSHISKELSKCNFEDPTPIQAQGWPIALCGRDLVGIGQTGSGKTLGYIIPGLIHIQAQNMPKRNEGPIALVLAPTRELVQQIHSVADPFAGSLGIRTAVAYGGANKLLQSRELRYSPSLCVATPGRLLDFLESEVTNMDRCTYLVLDEADRMLDMGFEPQIRSIINLIRPDRQTLMWSATWPKEIKDLAKDYLNNYIQLNIGSSQLRANPNIKQTFEIIEEHLKKASLINLIEDELNNENARILIFAQTKRKVDYLADLLNRKKIYARGIHGDHSQNVRNRTLQGFREGRVGILVATDVAARGLDVDDINLVVNYDFPPNVEDYIHRIGRTARANKTGKAHAFLTDEDYFKVKDLIKILHESNHEVPEELLTFGNGHRRERHF